MEKRMATLCALLVSLLSGTLAAGAGGGHSAPESAERDLREVIAPIRQKWNLPALAAAIVTGDGIYARGAVGVRKYGSEVPVTVDDQFHLGSCTKSMTAT